MTSNLRDPCDECGHGRVEHASEGFYCLSRGCDCAEWDEPQPHPAQEQQT